MAEPTADDEGRHIPGDDLTWQESWDLEFFADDGSLGGYARLAMSAAGRRVSFLAALVCPGRRLVSVVDHDVEPPRRDDFELRSAGLWVDLQCLVPGDHMTLGLECFGVGLDDPRDALGDGRGELVPLGLDLEWDTAGPVRAALGAGAGTGYDVACRVHGEVLVADERHELDGWGRRVHVWGPAAPALWPSTVAGRLADGRWLWGTEPADGAVVGDVAWAPAPVPVGGAMVPVWRGLGTLAATDGTIGWGWVTRPGWGGPW